MTPLRAAVGQECLVVLVPMLVLLVLLLLMHLLHLILSLADQRGTGPLVAQQSSLLCGR
jgi:hypothetical protein